MQMLSLWIIIEKKVGLCITVRYSWGEKFTYKCHLDFELFNYFFELLQGEIIVQRTSLKSKT